MQFPVGSASAASLVNKAAASSAGPGDAKAAAAAVAATETSAVGEVMRTDIAAVLKSSGLSSALPSAAVSAFTARLGRDVIAAAESAKTAGGETAAVSKALTSDVDSALKSLGFGKAVGSAAVRDLIGKLTTDGVKAFHAAQPAAAESAAAPSTANPVSAATSPAEAPDVAEPAAAATASAAAAAVAATVGRKVDGFAAEVAAPLTATVEQGARAIGLGGSPGKAASVATGREVVPTSTEPAATPAGRSVSAATRGDASETKAAADAEVSAPSSTDSERTVAEAARRMAVETSATSALSSILTATSGSVEALQKSETSFEAIVSGLHPGSRQLSADKASTITAPTPTEVATVAGQTATNDNEVSSQHPALRAYRDNAAA